MSIKSNVEKHRYCPECRKWKNTKEFMTNVGLICSECQIKRINKCMKKSKNFN